MDFEAHEAGLLETPSMSAELGSEPPNRRRREDSPDQSRTIGTKRWEAELGGRGASGAQGWPPLDTYRLNFSWRSRRCPRASAERRAEPKAAN